MLREDFAPPEAWLSENRHWLDAADRHWAPRAAEVLRVRAWMSSPVAWDWYTTVQIEGALQQAVIYLETGRTPDDVYGGIGAGWSPPAVPVVDLELSSGVLALASCGVPAPVVVETTRARRKRPRADVYGVEGKLTVAGGWTKAINALVATITTPWLDFYLVADRERLTRLLRDVSGIGRDAARGVGRVLGFEVERSTEDRSLVWRGCPMRPLPLPGPVSSTDLDADAYEARESGTRAPYWHRASRVPCAVPVMRRLVEVAAC